MPQELRLTPFWERVPSKSQHFELPKGSRFIEYEPSDEAWMRPLGIGMQRWTLLRPMYRVEFVESER